MTGRSTAELIAEMDGLIARADAVEALLAGTRETLVRMTEGPSATLPVPVRCSDCNTATFAPAGVLCAACLPAKKGVTP